MAAGNHAPGSWWVEEQPLPDRMGELGYVDYVILGHDHAPTDLEMSTYEVARIEDKGDALLIAAAPALLKVCKRAERYLAKCIDLDHLEEDPRDGLHVRLQEAIEKAEGKE